MKIVFSHPTGNANVRAILYGFLRADLLHSFHTSLAFFPDSKLNKFSSEISRRQYDLKLKPFTFIHPTKEIARIFSSKLKFHSLTKHEIGIFSIDQVYKDIDIKTAQKLAEAQFKGATAVYAYEDGALATFKVAKKLGIKCIYDLPIVYWETRKKIMFEEANRLPNWANSLVGGLRDSQEKLDRKTEELSLADSVVVASEFVKKSLPEFAINKNIIFSTFGSPKVNLEIEKIESNTTIKPLRVLFVGSMGQRKGLADLFKAINLVNSSKIELVVMGSLIETLAFYKNECRNFIYEPGRPNNEVLKLMQTCDVFCLPSLAEGRALVIQEAMSQGLPIIITQNTGGTDLVIEGETGFLVPIRSPESIAEKLIWFLNNREKIPIMGNNAKLHALKYTWENYSNKIIKDLQEGDIEKR